METKPTRGRPKGSGEDLTPLSLKIRTDLFIRLDAESVRTGVKKRRIVENALDAKLPGRPRKGEGKA